MILALIVDVLIPVIAALIGTHYQRFCDHYVQLGEPFTRLFSRIAEAFPWFWRPLQAVLLFYAALTALFAPRPWAVVGVYGLIFMGWFIPHIKAYIKAHHGDNPPLQLKAKLLWIGRSKP